MSEATDLARQHAQTAVRALVDVIEDVDSKGSEVVAAANALLDRGYGKPMQAIITVPIPARMSARLAALDDAALLAVISDSKNFGGGVHPQNGTATRGVENGRSNHTQALTLPATFSNEGGGVISEPAPTPAISKRRGRSTTRFPQPDIEGECVPSATPFEKALAATRVTDDPLAL